MLGIFADTFKRATFQNDASEATAHDRKITARDWRERQNQTNRQKNWQGDYDD